MGLVRISDTRLFVETRGTGPAVIVLHGGPGADHTQLLDPLLPLTDEFTLHFVDQRSQGRSDPAPRESWTIPRCARDVSELADALGASPYAALGHSFGALVCLHHAAAGSGDAVAYVVSHGVPSHRWYRLGEELDGFEPPELREQIRRAWADLEAASSAQRMTELIALQAPFHFKDPFNPAIEELNRRAVGQMIHTPTVNQHFSTHDLETFDIEESLSSIVRPVLLLTGRADRVCPMQATEFMAERIPQARSVVFEESGHVSYLEEPDAYLAAVRRFLRSHLKAAF